MTAGDADWEGWRVNAPGASFATLLRRYRRLAGLSQESLAERAGVSVRALSGMERAEGHVPYAETVRLLADALALAPTERAHFVAAARPATPRRPPADESAPPFGEPRPLAPRALRLAPRLPTPLTPLLGRASELGAAVALLRQPETRLLTVTGAPGVGKTSFARRLVASMEPGDFPDGVASLDLAPLDDARLVLPTLVEALAVGGPAQWAPAERLAAALSGRRALLLLDTFERLLAAGPDLLRLLEACDGLTALVTSRAPLGLPGEREFPLAPLAIPAQPDAHGAAPTPDAATLAALRASPAVALFVQRARSVRPDFALTGANAASVVALCRRLDGLPLAIELAAARVTLAPPHATLVQLDRQFALLTANPHDNSATVGYADWLGALRGAIAWSYDLLTPTEQWALRRLAVIEGGATLDAAEAICRRPAIGDEAATSSGGESIAPLDVLLSLTRQSLLVVERRGDDDAAPGRLRLLDTIRAYAWERLRASGEAADAQRAHARYYLALAEDAARRYRQGEPDVWEPLVAELANLRAALRWATLGAESDAAATGLRLATALGPLWYAVGQPQEGLRWLDTLLAQTEAIGGSQERSGAGPSLTEQRMWAKAQYMAGWLALDQGLRQRAIGSLTKSVGAFRAVYDVTSARAAVAQAARVDDATANDDEEQTDDANALGDALNRLGDVLWRQGRFASAEAVFEESLELRRRVGDEIAVAYSLNNLAAVSAARGHLDTAQRTLETGLALTRRTANERGEIGALCHLASIASRQGQATRAAALLEEALVVARLRGATSAELYILGEQGDLARTQGDLALAEARWQASLAAHLAAATPNPYACAQAWLALGDVARDAGQAPQAMGRYLQSLRLCREVTVVDGAVICLERIAALVNQPGNHADAVRLYGLADATRVRLGFLLEPDEREARDAALARARAALDAARFTLAWDTGAATPWEHGLALAQAAAANPET